MFVKSVNIYYFVFSFRQVIDGWHGCLFQMYRVYFILGTNFKDARQILVTFLLGNLFSQNCYVYGLAQSLIFMSLNRLQLTFHVQERKFFCNISCYFAYAYKLMDLYGIPCRSLKKLMFNCTFLL